MSSVEEINALREELANKRAARMGTQDESVAAQRQKELDNEKDRLLREIAEEEAVAQLLADAGQVVEKREGRTDQEVLVAAGAAQAIANGATQDEVNAALAEVKASNEAESVKVAEPLKPATPTLTTGTANTGASKEEEK